MKNNSIQIYIKKNYAYGAAAGMYKILHFKRVLLFKNFCKFTNKINNEHYLWNFSFQINYSKLRMMYFIS